MKSQSALHEDYAALLPSLGRLEKVMIEQLDHLVMSCGLTLGVPIESRVKSWESIAEKIDRKRLRHKSLGGIDDLVGLRVIFLFQRDLDPFHAEITKIFSILSTEDTSHRLADAQFGYKSQHYVLRIPHTWDGIPSFKGLTKLKIELQVRTLAQHIWATASHKLQYKREDSVPLPIRRSIYRVSALLETVDLEFTRVLKERDDYIQRQAVNAEENDSLNVDVLEAILDEQLPSKNKDTESEDYADLLVDLQHFGINTRGALRTLLTKHKSSVLRSDAREIDQRRSDDEEEEDAPEEPGERLADRLARNVFFTHVGLAREALCKEFGSETVHDWLFVRT